MVRICVVSDTHRDRRELMEAVVSSGTIDAVLHAGDETSDVTWLSERVRCPVYGVAGNWDAPSPAFPEELVLPQFGPTILLVHGHRLDVKRGLSGLAHAAKTRGAQIAVYGHTHTPDVKTVNHTLCINPGSLSQPRGRQERTYALLTIDREDEHFNVQVYYYMPKGDVVLGLQHVASLPARFRH